MPEPLSPGTRAASCGQVMLRSRQRSLVTKGRQTPFRVLTCRDEESNAGGRPRPAGAHVLRSSVRTGGGHNPTTDLDGAGNVTCPNACRAGGRRLGELVACSATVTTPEPNTAGGGTVLRGSGRSSDGAFDLCGERRWTRRQPVGRDQAQQAHADFKSSGPRRGASLREHEQIRR